MLDSSIEVTLGSTPVRGGIGNKLQYIYYHTAEMNVTITDTQWNLGMLAATVGATLETGNYYKQESVTTTAGSGSVSETPIAFDGETIYGWATSSSGATQKIEFTGSTFTLAAGSFTEGEVFCVRYYTANTTTGKAFTIDANMVPGIVKIVLESQLNSADVTTNKIGLIQIIIPRVALSGAFTLSMTADGIANTPLTGMALAYTPTSAAEIEACGGAREIYAYIIEVIDNTNWWDDVVSLECAGGDFDIANGESVTLTIYGITQDGISFKVPNGDLTFSTSASSIVEVVAETGVVTGAAVSGSSLIEFETEEDTTSGSPAVGSVTITIG